MIIGIKSFRISGPEEEVNDVLTWIRHITYKEFQCEPYRLDLVIVILESDMSSLLEACQKKHLTLELAGQARMAFNGNQELYKAR